MNEHKPGWSEGRQVVVRYAGVFSNSDQPTICERITRAGTDPIETEVMAAWKTIQSDGGFFVTIPISRAGINGHAIRWVTLSAVLDIRTRVLVDGWYQEEFTPSSFSAPPPFDSANAEPSKP